ncbi:MAG: DUF4177 domain-containing protein [Kiritimatiellia bacterium]
MADVTFDCPECSHNLIVDDLATGMVVPCPECGTQIRVPAPETDLPVSEAADAGEDLAAHPDAGPGIEPVAAPEMTCGDRREYKVVSMMGGAGAGSILRADEIETWLNERTQEGWRLCAATTMQTRSQEQDTAYPELLLFLERRICSFESA